MTVTYASLPTAGEDLAEGLAGGVAAARAGLGREHQLRLGGVAQQRQDRWHDQYSPIDRELLVGPGPYPTVLGQYPTVLGQALNLLAGAALRYRERLGLPDTPWALIGFFAQGRLLAPPVTPLTS